jgi:hypothetical protein
MNSPTSFSCQTMAFRPQPPPPRGSPRHSLHCGISVCANPSPFHLPISSSFPPARFYHSRPFSHILRSSLALDLTTRSYIPHRLFVLCLIRVIQVALNSCRRALRCSTNVGDVSQI